MPDPKDVEAFEAVYEKEHVPMAIANLPGKTKMVSKTVFAVIVSLAPCA